MFGSFRRYVGSLFCRAVPGSVRGTDKNHAQVAILPPSEAPEKSVPSAYRIAAAMSWRGTVFIIRDRRNDRIVGCVPSLAQALTLRDALELAGGALPSRRFLDAVHQAPEWPLHAPPSH